MIVLILCSFSNRYFDISSCMNGAKPWLCFYLNLFGNKHCLLFILYHVLCTKWLNFVLTCFYIMQRWHFILYKGLFLWFWIFCAYLICKNYFLSCHSLILYFLWLLKMLIKMKGPPSFKGRLLKLLKKFGIIQLSSEKLKLVRNVDLHLFKTWSSGVQLDYSVESNFIIFFHKNYFSRKAVTCSEASSSNEDLFKSGSPG